MTKQIVVFPVRWLAWVFPKNIKECYRFIFDEYNAGDQKFLSGFSRGATTVRSLSSFIHLIGIRYSVFESELTARQSGVGGRANASR